MVKIKFGAVVVEGRGKLGGHVFSRNRTSNYMRSKVTPVNPSTQFQQNARSLLASLSQAWSQLSETEREAWRSAVSSFESTNVFGDTIQPTGKNLYTKLNANLTLIGQSTIGSPPTPEPVSALDSLTLSVAVTNAQMDVEYTPSPSPASTTYLVYATNAQSPGKNFVSSEYRKIDTIGAASTSPHDLEPAWTSRFGSFPSAGLKIFVKVVPINNDTGQAGTALSASSIVGS